MNNKEKSINIVRHLFQSMEKLIMNKHMTVLAATSGMVIILALVLSLPATAQVAGSAPNSTAPVQRGSIDPADLEVFLDDFFARNMEELNIPGAAFVMVKDGEVFFAKGYGYADLENQIPVDPELTIFRVGSVSKLFTATAIMQLAEQGVLNLDTDINQYLTNFKIAGTYSQPVTLAQLLTHTAGFEDRYISTAVSSEDDLLPMEAFLADYAVARVNPPGTVHSYSNYSFNLAGHLVEVMSGIPFAQYVEENILTPLGMERTTFFQPLPDNLSSDLARSYSFVQDAYIPGSFVYLHGPPEGALSATVLDISRFMIAHLQDGRYQDVQILAEGTAQEMHQQQFTHHPDLPGMTYGFKERFINGMRVIGHGGDIDGYASQMILLPGEDIGIFVSYNIYNDAFRNDLVSAFFDHYYPSGSETSTFEQIALNPQELARFNGAYRWVKYPRSTMGKAVALPPGPFNWTIHANEDGTLSLAVFGISAEWRYAPVEPLVFKQVSGEPLDIGGFNIDPGTTLVFREDQTGKITFAFVALQNVAMEKLAWYEGSLVQLGSFATILIIFLSAIIFWPLGSLINRLRKKPSNPDGKRARLLAGTISFLNVVFSVIIFISISPQFVFGVPTIVKIALVIPIITTMMTLYMLYVTFQVWQGYNWSVLGKVHYSLITLAALVFIGWVNYWNLLGWRF